MTGPARAEQNVVLRQVAVHDAGAQHAHDFPHQERVVRAAPLRRENSRSLSRGAASPSRVGHEFHQQHAFVKVVRGGHAHAGGGKPVQRIDFGALPRLFLDLAAEARAFVHRARLAAVLGLAAFGVIDGLAKTAFVGFLVDLGAA